MVIPWPHGPPMHITAYPDSWYARTMQPATPRPALGKDLEVAVCVIGAGLAGLTAARTIAEAGWPVAVLEAERVGFGASGRNGGFVSAGYAERLDAIAARIGLDQTRALYQMSVEGREYVRETIRAHALPGVDPRPGKFSVKRYDDPDGTSIAVERLRRDFGTRNEYWPTGRVREVLRTHRYFQANFDPDAFHIHPLNYVLGLAGLADAAGARIYESTRVVSADLDGVVKRIVTKSGTVKAEHVVLAANDGLIGLVGRIGRAVLPVATYVGVTEKLGARLAEAVRTPAAVSDTRRSSDYYRIVDGDRLLWGGRITTRRSVPPHLKAQVGGDIAAVFPQLGRPVIEAAWVGIMGYARHKMPIVGELQPGVWSATAFGGHGLAATATGGLAVARGLLTGDDGWRRFSPYGPAWGGGPVGRVATQLAYWYMQARDVMEERRAERNAARAP